MSIRKRTVLIICITVVLLFVIGLFSSAYIILHGFTSVETADTTQHVQRALDGIENKVTALATQVDSYGIWDDTYQFMINHNQTYAKTNLIYDTAIKTQKINFLLLVDTKGQTIASLHMDYLTGKDIPIPHSLQVYLQPGSRLLTHRNKDDYVSGFIPDGSKSLIIVSRPIVTSDDKGPDHGTVIFGRYVDNAFLEDVTSVTHENITIYPYQDATLPADFVNAKQHLIKMSEIYITSLSWNQITGYGIFRDPDGKPGAIIRIALPRVIYLLGLQTIKIFTVLFGMTTLILALVMILLLEKIIIARILRLHTAVQTIEKSKDSNGRIPFLGNDEIGKLAQETNTVLVGLNQAVLGEQESKERFRHTADIAPVMMWMLDVDMKCTYVNKAWLNFTWTLLQKQLGDGWLDYIHPDDRNEYIQGCTKVLQERSAYRKEIRIKRADGQYRWIATQVIPQIKDGIAIGCFCAGNDVTDIKQSIAEIARVNRILEGREASLTELQKENDTLKTENARVEKNK